jgi:hypothetical protein
MIDREALQAMSDHIKTRTDWDIGGPMLWGYFLTNDARGPLDAAAEKLKARGYRLVDIYLADKDESIAPGI